MSEQTNTIKEKAVALISDRLGVSISEVTPEKYFSTDLGADSLDTVELIMECEKEWDIKIPDEDAEKLKTVGDVIAYLEKNVKK